MMNSILIPNMANLMAEDSGLFELRNPKVSGMHKQGWIARLTARIRRH